MTYVLVFTFYRGDDLVGVDVQPIPKPVSPMELFMHEITAPSDSDLAVVSCSELESDELIWIQPFGMLRAHNDN